MSGPSGPGRLSGGVPGVHFTGPDLENLTHTLIGLAAGESFARCTRGTEAGLPQGARRTLFVVLAAIGGNAPDVDLAWSYTASDRRLAYMLEHRGYTHTVLGCLVLAGLLYAGAEWWMHSRRLVPAARDRFHLALVAVFGTLLHLGMDTLNSYGVHPFWPFDNRWFYGDSIFIAEPLFWLASAPLVFVVRSRVARVLMALALSAAVAAALWMHRGEPLIELAIVVVALGLLVVGKHASPRAAALTSTAATVVIVGVSVACGAVAASRTDAIADSSFRGYHTLDHILTPAPTYPVCWEVLLLQTRGDLYTVRHGLLSVAPGSVPVRHCPTVFPLRPTSGRSQSRSGVGTTSDAATKLPPSPPATPVAAPTSAEILWFGEYSMSKAQLRHLVHDNCRAAALMQFARAPFAFRYGNAWHLGDLRFAQGAGFQIEVSGGRATCSIRVPWVPPRADDLLRGRAR